MNVNERCGCKEIRTVLHDSGLELRDALLLTLLVLRRGVIEGMVQNGRYLGSSVVRDIFCLFIRNLEDLYGTPLLNRLPTSEELADIERLHRRNGLPGCAGLLKNVRMKLRAETEFGKSTDLHGQCLSDLSGYCWCWDTSFGTARRRCEIEHSACEAERCAGTVWTNDFERTICTKILEKIRKNEFRMELDDRFRICEDGASYKKMYVLVNDETNVTGCTLDERKLLDGVVATNNVYTETIGDNNTSLVNAFWYRLKESFEFLKGKLELSMDDYICALNSIIILSNVKNLYEKHRISCGNDNWTFGMVLWELHRNASEYRIMKNVSKVRRTIDDVEDAEVGSVSTSLIEDVLRFRSNGWKA